MFIVLSLISWDAVYPSAALLFLQRPHSAALSIGRASGKGPNIQGKSLLFLVVQNTQISLPSLLAAMAEPLLCQGDAAG
ncbi:MAG: hypothetical protein MJ075_06220 [Oscillospiraceae bacterium]|nr:hypothetical protein [Oscillospiraceae bacterium]